MNSRAGRGKKAQDAGIKWVAAGRGARPDSARNRSNQRGRLVAAATAVAARASPDRRRSSGGRRLAGAAPAHWTRQTGRPAMTPETSLCHDSDRAGLPPCCVPRRYPPAIAAEEKQSGATMRVARAHHTTVRKISRRVLPTAADKIGPSQPPPDRPLALMIPPRFNLPLRARPTARASAGLQAPARRAGA